MSHPIPLPENDSVEDTHEDRRERRRRTLKAGRVVVNDAFSTINVVIKDMSDCGARLSLFDPWIMPPEFTLVVLNTNTAKPERFLCARRWQKATMVGVEFIRDEARISAAQTPKPYQLFQSMS